MDKSDYLTMNEKLAQTVERQALEIERLRAALRAARPIVDAYHGHHADPAIVLIDAALEEK